MFVPRNLPRTTDGSEQVRFAKTQFLTPLKQYGFKESQIYNRVQWVHGCNFQVLSEKIGPDRWIQEVLGALTSISILFAEHGPGRFLGNTVAAIETEYMRYRENYNSY